MSAVALLQTARKLMEQRQVAQSLDAYRTLTAQYPRYAEGWFHRSGTESGLGQALTAVASAKEAVALEPNNLLYRAHLAQMQVNYGLWGDAIGTLAPLRSIAPERVEARIANTIGSVFSLTGEHERAQPWFARAAAAAPGSATYRYNEAQGLLYCGETDAARERFHTLIGKFPHFAKALWSLSTFEGAAGGEARVRQLREALVNAGNPMDEVLCCYALFNMLDALDRRTEAFFELESGMRLQRARIRYDGQDLAQLARLPAAADALAAPDRADADAPVPIFIVGLPRSGTTLVERVVGNNDDVAQGGELFCFAAALHEHLGVQSPAGAMLSMAPAELLQDRAVDWPAVGRRYLELTAYRRGGRRFHTDKFPFNFLLLPWIAAALPQARIVHVRRDPLDTCFSNLKHLFARSYGASYSQDDMARYYRGYHGLMRGWHDRLRNRILDIRLETLVADPETTTRRMLEFCGLPPNPDAWRIERNTQPVSTASAVQVRQPINDRGIGAWRRYEAQLQPLARFFAAHPELT